ncbi:hypothetical protein FXF50_04630 [Micromonospora sp. AP08]|nr:hypothetical protein FXF50_04630 [Micromonospora sp. AP08]
MSALLGDMSTDRCWQLEHEGASYEMRALTSRDVAAAVHAGSPEEARAALVRAVLGRAPGEENPDEGMSAAVAASLAEHDRGAEILLACTCAHCGAEWEDVLDVARFVTAEIAHHGVRLLTDVAELARAFGWSEHAILDLPDARRRAYLALTAG